MFRHYHCLTPAPRIFIPGKSYLIADDPYCTPYRTQRMGNLHRTTSPYPGHLGAITRGLPHGKLASADGTHVLDSTYGVYDPIQDDRRLNGWKAVELRPRYKDPVLDIHAKSGSHLSDIDLCKSGFATAIPYWQSIHHVSAKRPAGDFCILLVDTGSVWYHDFWKQYHRRCGLRQCL